MHAQLLGRTLAWIVIVAVLLLALTGPHVPAWLVSLSVAAALVLGTSAGLKQKRMERDFARRLWRKRERRIS